MTSNEDDEVDVIDAAYSRTSDINEFAGKSAPLAPTFLNSALVEYSKAAT